MIYCVVPPELGDESFRRLVEHYKDNPNVKVILDRRQGERRTDRSRRRRAHHARPAPARHARRHRPLTTTPDSGDAMNEPLPRGSETSLVLTHLMQPADANFMGNIHGGIIMKLIDEAAGACAYRFCRTKVVTAAIDRIDFHHPVQVGDLVRLRANVNFAGRTSVEVGVRVEAEDLTTGMVAHTNSAYLVFVALSDSGKPIPVPPLVPRDRRAEALVRRSAGAAAQAARGARAGRLRLSGRRASGGLGAPAGVMRPRAPRPRAAAAPAAPDAATSSWSALGSLVVNSRCISMPGRRSVRASGWSWWRAIQENSSIAVPMLTSPAMKVASGLRSWPAARSTRLVATLVTIIGAMRLEPQRACSLSAVGRIAAALVGRHALVLGAVVPRQARVAQEQQDRSERHAGGRELLEKRRAALRAAQGDRRHRARRRGGEHPRVFLRQHRAAGRAAHGRQHRRRIRRAAAGRAARAPAAGSRGPGAAPSCRRSPSRRRPAAHGGGPEPLALQEHSVPQRHAAERHVAHVVPASSID